MFREYNKKDELTKEELLADKDFVNDASTFLNERGGIKKPMSPEETYDAFMEHMRFHNVNEVTTIRDLEYAQNSNLEGKLRFGNLIDAYDKLDGEVSLTSALDYAEGIATAPSTYLGLISAGTGKAAAVAGTQAAKIGVRKILSEALKGSAKAAAVEGSIGFGQGLAQEGVRVETGMMPEMTGDLAMQTGLLSAAGAGIINFPVAAMQSKRASRANELYESAQLNQAKKATQASEKSKEVLKAAPKAEANKIKSELKALDADKVKKGRQIKQQSSTSETLEASIPPETIENIAAAGLRVRELLKMKKGERITSVMQRMLSDNKLPDADIQKILDEHNLTYDEFSLMYLAEVSDAGRVLGAQGRLSQALTPQARRAKKNQVDDMMDSLDKLNKGGKSSIDSTTAKKLAENRNGVGGFFKDLDRARLGVMTSQPATTMRNNLNAGFRIAVDMSTRAFDNALNLRNPFDGTLDIVNYTLNPYEAQVIKKMFTESFPVEAGRLFREAADLEARSGSEGALATLGRKVNVLNTMSDNLWKKSVLSASLKRRLSDAGIEMTEEARNTLLRNRLLRQMDEASADQVLKTAKGDDLQKLYGEYGLLKKNMDLYDFIETGQLKKLPQDILKDSIEDAYSFVYQTSMKGDNLFGGMAKAVIKGHQDYPMLISSVLPFPRYIANQLKFVYEHAPLIGLMPLDRIGSKAPARSFKEYMQEKLPKQMTGALMMTAAYNWRAKQGDTEYWYEFKDNNGNVIDGRAVYGPFAPFMLAADLIYRHQRGTMPVSIHSYARDTLQALAGSTFRVGLGLYTLDKLYTDVESGAGQKVIAEGLANIINTFTIPASAARDLYAQFDKDARGIPETRTGSMNFYDILYQRATRSLPKNFASDAEEDGFLGFGDAAERATSPFQTGELMQINPLEKQIFGFSKRPAKNSLQNEMGRLNMQPYDLYKRDPNEKRDLYVRQELSKEDGPLNLNDRMSRIIASDAYQRFGDDADGLSIKRDVFDTEVKRIIQEARNIADAKIEKDAFDVNAKYTDSDQVEWMRMNKLLKGRIDAEYRKVFGGESVSADRDKTVTIDNKEINVLRWALSRASQVRGKGGGL